MLFAEDDGGDECCLNALAVCCASYANAMNIEMWHAYLCRTAGTAKRSVLFLAFSISLKINALRCNCVELAMPIPIVVTPIARQSNQSPSEEHQPVSHPHQWTSEATVPDDNKGKQGVADLSSGRIAGIVVAVVVLAGCTVGVLLYLFVIRKGEDSGEGAAS
jgi:hypothetical protein